ncbi:MAG: hypothetical protein IBX56_10125 [Methylomicrobium sp.]|nr:hypothetical protein [Methylomicrobium sp.]
MNKSKLISSLGSAVAVSLLASPLAQASENPFSLQKVTVSTQLAQAGDKSGEGKCSDGKCGDKMKEGGCSGAMMGKSKEGKCGEGKCGDKLKEGGCSASMPQSDEE